MNDDDIMIDMVEGQKSYEHFYPLSSENKQEGWNYFLKYIPLLQKKNLPTYRELPIIHRLATRGAQASTPPESLQFEAMVRLITDNNPIVEDRSDLRAAGASVRSYFDDIIRTEPEAIYRVHAISLASGKEPRSSTPLRFHIFMPLRGHLRQYGTRSIGGGYKQVVHAPHHKPLYDRGDKERTEEAFIGLTEGLASVFKELCDTADGLLKSALEHGDLEDRLRAAVFLSLWGVTVVHPFVDGNGRAFGAKLVLDLNRMGLNVRKMPSMGEVAEELKENALAGLGDMFLLRFLEHNGMQLMSPEQLGPLMNDPVRLHRYMSSLRAGILEGIRQGVSKDSPYADLIEAGMTCLKLSLSRDGHIDPGFYQTNIASVIEANTAERESWK